MSHVAVIGAGVTGITTAYALALRGYDVTVLDRNRDPAMGTSYANGGQLSASNAEVWTTAATILKGIKWMMRRDAPLLVNPWPSWHKYSWMAEFVGQIPNYRRNTVDTVRLAIIAQKHLTRIAETEGIEFHRENTGILHLYRAKAGFDHAMQVNELLSEGGLDRKAVTPEEMRAIEPTLQGDYYGGFYTASDFTGDIHAFTRGLASACERRGVKFMYDTDVRLLAHQGGGIAVDWHHADKRREPRALETLKADAVVICAGVASPRFARQLGDRVNIYPVKGYSITIPLLTEQSSRGAPRVSLLDDETKIVSSRLGERFRVAGTAEFNGYNLDIRADRIRPLAEWTRDLFPEVDTSSAIPWAGLRPMTPSMVPRVGSGSRKGVFYNTGHGHLGWTLSAATAETVAETVHAAIH
ncbi:MULTISPECIES: D-amino acid dehydrogenase [unclassified Acidisoma]|uniref:D-amino acid dehydrogenase n=1 Tax=unclassified Acidisoma TaxID=2634065 RepID=UPI00131D3A95|nr:MULTISPECIES: D-amino acid dehydrogenase [unclassified Acidisoma]